MQVKYRLLDVWYHKYTNNPAIEKFVMIGVRFFHSRAELPQLKVRAEDGGNMVDNKRTESSRVAMQLVLNLYMPFPNPHCSCCRSSAELCSPRRLGEGLRFFLKSKRRASVFKYCGIPAGVGLAWLK